MLIGVIVLPIVVAAARAVRNQWFPIGDSALLYIRARDVLTEHHPLLGSWTSASLSVGENMNNPGSTYDVLIAPIARTFAFSSAAAIGVAIVNVLSIVGVSAVARSIGGWTMQRWMLLAAAVLTWVMGSELLIDIFQAHALLLPFLLLVVLVTGLAIGRADLLPWTAGVATLLVQTHISYVYVLLVLGITTLTVVLLTRGFGRWRLWRQVATSRPVLATIIVLAVLWAQPLWEQFFGAGKGNLARLATNASGGDVRVGPSIALRFSARVLAQPPWALRDEFSSLLPPTGVTETADGPSVLVTGIMGTGLAMVVLIALVAVLGGFGWSAHRRGHAARAAACWIAAGGVAGTPLCISLITVGNVGFAQHHVRWLWAFGAFVSAVVLWSVLDLVLAWWRVPNARRIDTVVPIGLSILMAVLAVPYHAQRQGPVADEAVMPALRRVFRELDRLTPLAPILYDTRNLRVYEPYSSAVMMRMQELGIEFRVRDEGMVRQLGDGRRADGTEPTTVFQLEGVDALTYAGPACLISAASALDADADQAASATLERLVASVLEGRVIFDLDRLAADDFTVAKAAVEGDSVAARHLVLDGTLAAALDTGTASGGPELRDQLAVIEPWSASTFALFATTTGDCRS